MSALIHAVLNVGADRARTTVRRPASVRLAVLAWKTWAWAEGRPR